jgi:hypothetical protein
MNVKCSDSVNKEQVIISHVETGSESFLLLSMIRVERLKTMCASRNITCLLSFFFLKESLFLTQTSQ